MNMIRINHNETIDNLRTNCEPTTNTLRTNQEHIVDKLRAIFEQSAKQLETTNEPTRNQYYGPTASHVRTNSKLTTHVEHVERFLGLGLSIITKWVPSFVVFWFFYGAATSSETGGFVMLVSPVGRCIVCWNKSDRDFDEEHQCGSPLSPSVDFIEELQCAQHCRGSFNLVGGQRI